MRDGQGRRKEFFKGGRFKWDFSKKFLFALISSLMFYTVNVAPSPPPIFLRPCRPIPAYSFLAQCIDSRAYAVLLLALSDTEIIRNTRGTFGQVCTGRARRPGVA